MNDVKQMALDHWTYVESVLLQHDVNYEDADTIGFHYQTAFIHGYKHGKEAAVELLFPKG